MKASTFISLMLLLLVFTTGLLLLANPRKQEPKTESISEDAGNGTQLQTAEGSMIWESISRHLLSAVQ